MALKYAREQRLDHQLTYLAFSFYPMIIKVKKSVQAEKYSELQHYCLLSIWCRAYYPPAQANCNYSVDFRHVSCGLYADNSKTEDNLEANVVNDYERALKLS